MTKEEAHEIAIALANMVDAEAMCQSLNKRNLPFLWVVGKTYMGNTACARMVFVVERITVSGIVIQILTSVETTS